MKKTLFNYILLASLLISRPAYSQYLMEDETGVVRGRAAGAGGGEMLPGQIKRGPALLESEPGTVPVEKTAEKKPAGEKKSDKPAAGAAKPAKRKIAEAETEGKAGETEKLKGGETEKSGQGEPEEKTISGRGGTPARRPGHAAAEPARTRAEELSIPPLAAGGLGWWDRHSDGDLHFDFDFDFPMGNGNTLRYYNTRAGGAALRNGAEWRHGRPNGRFRKWEVTKFAWTPQMDDSFGVKYSSGREGRTAAFAMVHLPEIETWAAPGRGTTERSQRLAFAASLRKETAPRFFFTKGRFSSYYTIDRTYQMGFLGTVPVGHSLSRADFDPRAALAWNPRRGSVFEIAYRNKVRLGEVAYNLVAARPHRDLGDWFEIAAHNHAGDVRFSQSFRNGALHYGMTTTPEFAREVETVGGRYSARGWMLNAEYTRNLGYNDFYEAPDKEITRLSVTKPARGDWEAGLLFEARRGGRFAGFQVYTEGAGGDRLPDTVYRKMKVPDITYRGDWRGDDELCDSIKGLGDAVGKLKSAFQVAAYTDCLNRPGYLQEFFKVAPPVDVVAGAEANCISTAWLQSYILNRNGYIAYPVGLQSSKLFFGDVRKGRYDSVHAVVAYKRPGWKHWRLMEYNGLANTTGETIEEALRAYDPSYTGFTVFDPGNLTMLGVYNNATFDEIDRWIADED